MGHVLMDGFPYVLWLSAIANFEKSVCALILNKLSSLFYFILFLFRIQTQMRDLKMLPCHTLMNQDCLVDMLIFLSFISFIIPYLSAALVYEVTLVKS